MSDRATVFAIVVVVGSMLACGSDPPPAASAPPADITSAPTAQPTVAAVAPVETSTPAAAPAIDLNACMSHMDPSVPEACKACAASSCADPIKTVGAMCPGFSQCLCDGKPMAECGPKLAAPGCGPAGNAVGRCVRQSCGALCSSLGGAPSTAATAPAATSGDACTDLTACCAQVPGGTPPSCAKLVATKNTQACGSLLTMFRNMNKCH
jgi:hypothetical protein